MQRTIEQWTGCDPHAMATHQSVAAIENAFADAKADILELHEQLQQAQQAEQDALATMHALDQEKQALLAIPPDVLDAAKSMQRNGYRGPLAWAAKVIDFVANRPTAAALSYEFKKPDDTEGGAP